MASSKRLRGRAVRIAPIAAAVFVALFVRRWEQLLHPQVWNEDGIIIVGQLVHAGPASVLWPVNGYLVLVPRLIAFVALSISPVYYPLLGTLLTWGFIVAVGVAIAESPIGVRGGPLLVLATFFVPTDPEVFGIPLYAFWWAALLIVLAALWRANARGTSLRVAFVLAGGLSSPVILLALPAFVARAVIRRRDARERVVATVAALCALAQAAVLVHEHNQGTHTAPTLQNATTVVLKFLGSYVAGDLAHRPPWGSVALGAGAVVTLAVVAFALARARSDRRELVVLLALLFFWFGSIVLTLPRVDVALIDPVTAGPRYFFYAFVFEGWFLVHVLVSSPAPALRAAAAALLALAVPNVVPNLSRAHDDLAWSRNLVSCAAMPGATPYALPVETDGRASTAWSLTLSAAQCRGLVDRDLLVALHAPVPQAAPFAIARIEGAAPPRDLASAAAIVANGWKGTDSQRTRLPGLVVVGSYRTSDADTGTLTLRLRRGERVLFRSGPVPTGQRVIVRGAGATGALDAPLPVANDWVELTFASPALPESFLAAFEDEGTGWGEWSAVALAR